MLARVGESHSHVMRAARSGLEVSTRDRRLVGYRVPNRVTEGGDVDSGLQAEFEGRLFGPVWAFKCSMLGCWMCYR
jgi:hypothetical protein